MSEGKKRCSWVSAEPIYETYHDDEWGVPVRDSLKLFEIICLEGAQAGLSWITVLKKRENYRQAFDGFDPCKMAMYKEDKILKLMQNEGIIRHRGKIEAFVGNAQAYLRMSEQGEDFAEYIWSFVDSTPVIKSWNHHKEIPASTPQSEAMSRSLKKKGFKFVGSTICYAFMQAAGLVNDHENTCFKKEENSPLT